MIENMGRAGRRGVQIVWSPFDPRVKLHIDRTGIEAYIEFHEDTAHMDREDMLMVARMKGFVEDDDPFADPYEMNVPMDDGMWRTYLTFTDTLPDIPLQRGEMPDPIPVAYGPHSGVMEAV